MKLLCLGTTGYHPNDLRHTACFMLPEIGVVLDAGTGMYRVRDHLVTPHLHIFITHAHVDHIMGLTFLYDVLNDRPVSRANVYGEAEKLAAIREHLFSEPLFPVAPPCDFLPLDGPVTLPGGAKLTHFPVDHPGGAIGYRIDWSDRSMAYVTDTIANPTAAYVEKIRGVDLLVHECYFADDQTALADLTGHSHITPVAQVARAADVGRLLLVHLNPLIAAKDPVGLGEARAIFPAAELGVDHLAIDF
ncbi:MAG TPA: MBL fold metallo-hydrolase [Pirellulales bacterium]|nr:MBL fold metallo-hydrolase [Pirellulales bacterium]